jgi:RNA polymerase sigma-70 factor (ECF subfamily)
VELLSDVRPSPEGFEAWVAPHLSAMRSFAARLTSSAEADDVVQDALLAAWRLRDRYDPAKGSPGTWLLTLTADHARRHLKRARREPVWPAAEGTVVDATADVDLRAAISRLTHRQQVAVAAFYYLDLPVAEVAMIMDCSVGTVKSTLADARTRLHALLGGASDGV